MQTQKLSKTHLRRMLLLSSLAVLLLSVLGLFLIKLHLDGQAQSALSLSEKIVSRLQAEKMQQLATQTKDYAYWGDSVAAVQTRDTAWAEENLGSYLLETFSIDMSLAADRNGRIFFQASAKDGAPQALTLLQHPGVLQLLAKTFEESKKQPVPVSGIITIEGQTMMVAASVILPDSDAHPDYQRDHSLLLIRLLDADYLSGIEQLLFLEQMTLTTTAREGYGNLPLISPLGRTLGYLSWRPRVSSGELSTLALIFGAFTSAIILIAVGLLWQLYRLARRYEQNAIVDDLTGLFNRRYFNSIAEQEMRRLCRDEYLIGFLLLDVDNFKKYNDRYGHQAGDTALKQISSAMSNAFGRASDHVCRLGGEEFGVIFIGRDEQQIRDMAEALRSTIEGLGIVHEGNVPHGVITVSIGGIIAHPEQRQCDLDKAYSLADKTLYQAKARGRNTVYLKSSDSPD